MFVDGVALRDLPIDALEQVRVAVEVESKRRFIDASLPLEKAARSNGMLGETYGAAGPPARERLTLDNVQAAFTYQPWTPDQRQLSDQVRDVLVAAAKTILRTVPDTPTRSRALSKLFDARMLANAAITHRGRF